VWTISILLIIANPALGDKKDKKQSTSSTSGVAKAQGPPPFFLQDPADGLCLAGEEFKRCSVDTLFYVIGSPGSYSIVKRPHGEDDAADSSNKMCLAKPSCAEKDALKVQDLKIAPCTHCGAKSWNILGDSDTGYVLTEGGLNVTGSATKPVKLCLVREKQSRKAKLSPCDSQDIVYTPLQLQVRPSIDSFHLHNYLLITCFVFSTPHFILSSRPRRISTSCPHPRQEW